MNKPSSPEPASTPDGLPFSRRLRRARMARGWSQLSLAQRMFVVAADYGGSATVEALKGMISKWERGKKGISSENAHLAAETLGTTVAELGLRVDPDFVWRKTTTVDADAPGVDSADNDLAGGRRNDAVRPPRRRR
jgi:transcriptional regulator with XRE-family HTH domain